MDRLEVNSFKRHTGQMAAVVHGHFETWGSNFDVNFFFYISFRQLFRQNVYTYVHRHHIAEVRVM